MFYELRDGFIAFFLKFFLVVLRVVSHKILPQKNARIKTRSDLRVDRLRILLMCLYFH